MKKVLFGGAVALAALSSVPASAADLITNGGFEAGNSGFTSGYTYVGTPGPTAMYPEGTYTVGANAQDYHNLWANVGAYSGESYLIANGAPGNNVNVWSQTVSGLTVGKTYNFSAYITNVCCNGSFGGNNGTPVIVATDGGTLNLSATATGTGNWTQLAGSFVATGASTTLNIYNDNSVASGNDFGLDQISLTAAVPEPAAWAMMIGGVGLVGSTMRRRKAKTAVVFA